MGGYNSRHLVEFELSLNQEVTTALKLVAIRNYADTPFFEKLLDGFATYIDGNSDIPVLEQLEALGAAEDLFCHITAILLRYSSHARLCGRAFATIINICRYCDNYGDGSNKITYCNQNIRGFGTAGACEAVVNALKAQVYLTDDYGAEQSLIGCMALVVPKQNLTCVDDAVKTVFPARDQSIEMLSIGCNLLICLSQENGENIVKLRNAGACEVLIALAQTHIEDRDVVCAVFSAIEHISTVSPIFKIAIVTAGCCDVLVAGLNAHYEDKCTATLGLEMISSLTGGPGLGDSRIEHQHKLRKAGACEALVQTLGAHAEDYEVAISGCHAAYNLSLHNATNQLRFGAVGGCELVVQIFRCHGFEPCKKYFDLIKTLTENNDDNVERFIGLGVRENLTTFEDSGTIQRGSCSPIRMFFS